MIIDLYIYLSVVILCFIILLFALLILNEKLHYFKVHQLIFSYVVYIFFFFLFSKIVHMIINNDFYVFFVKLNKTSIKKFLLLGYAFIGGYIGTMIFVNFISKIFKLDKNKLFILYMSNMLLFYAILKISCYVKGCCGGYLIIPIQLIETFTFLGAYLYIIYLILHNINLKTVLSRSIILFGILRLVLSIFKIYSHLYSFIVIEILCLIIIVIGYKMRWKNE